MIKFIFSSLCILSLNLAFSQYWFGPKFGLHQTSFEFDNTLYKKDSFNVDPTFGYQAGAVLVYEATSMYSVQTEILYKKIDKKVTNKIIAPVTSTTEYNYLSIPFFLRVSFGSEPIHYFIGGGPEINWWLSGSGQISDLDELVEAAEDNFTYDIEFDQTESDGFNRRLIDQPNRVQYGLSAIAGLYLDLRTNGRLLIEGRFQWGHSNMAFNDSPDFTFESYYENFEFRTNMASVSISYLFHYDAAEANKGMSTISDSEKAAIKAKKKRKN